VPRYPFTVSLDAAQQYYGPSLSRPQDAPTLYSAEPQGSFYESSALGFGIGVGALFASGFIPTGKGGRVWDWYTNIARGIEEYSPGAVLRTFQISPFISQFQSTAKVGAAYSAEFLADPANIKYLDYLTKLIGPDAGDLAATHSRLVREGVELRGGKLYYGRGGLALQYAARITAPKGAGMQYGLGYAASIGEVLGKANLPISEGDELVEQIIGGRTRAQFAARQIAGWGTTFVGRFRELLAAPFEIEPFRSVFSYIKPAVEKIGGKYGFSVKPGSGTQMLGRLAVKYGVGMGALYMGYQTADYLMRQSTLLDDTLFGEGLTTGIATVGVRANLALSNIAEVTGLHSYREAQEEIAPGSTSLQKLIGFPLVGFLGAAAAGYGANVFRMAKMQIREGVPLSTVRETAEEVTKGFAGKGLFASLGRAVSRTSGIYSREDIFGRIFRKIAEPTEGGELSFKFIGKVGPVKLAGLIGAGIGVALTLPFLPGALIPSQRPEELEAIYSGRQEVPIRKGRWWEFGRSPYEGQRIMYYRPHWYPRMRMRAKEKAIYGEEELSPFEKFWKREFTYELEKEHYRERPYPITALPFEDVPLVGPLLAATVGRLIKPERLMHTEEWLTEQGAVAQPPGFGARVATEIGQKPPGLPVSPYTIPQTVGEQAYRFTEMIGLPGFVMTSVKERLTGTPELFDQVRQLESARRMAGYEREYWDLELGGMLGMNEAFRRLFPHRRRQIPLYNPIRNLMPEWLPGPGERGPDLLHGDPYTKVQEGELRLPGRGYEERFPELRGVSPEDYPLIHQYRILADVAPYTEKFKEARQQVRVARARRRTWSDREEEIFQDVKEQKKAKRERKTFDRYQYLTPMGGIFEPTRDQADDSTGLLTAINEYKASKKEETGLWSRLFGGYWEAISHNAETAWDQLTPASPAAKLIHQRTAIEDYERTQLYGSANAFWSHPWRDFLRPFFQSAAAGLGFRGTPEHLEDRRDIEKYFDTLKYVKNARLAQIARESGDKEALEEFEARKDETLLGVNPYTRNYTSLYRALPRAERDYFAEFEKAETPEERQRILEMIPENERGLYAARWKLSLADDIRRVRKKGVLTEAQEEEADKILDEIYDEARNEGFPKTKELLQEFFATRLPGESYPDWYRRTKVLADVQLPGPDWCGWHPSVDLKDIKLKLVQHMGEDMHEYDLWRSRVQELPGKPFVSEEAIAPLIGSNSDVSYNINDLFLSNGARPSVFFENTWGSEASTQIDIQQEVDTDELIREIM
jgi:hypothetical protein